MPNILGFKTPNESGFLVFSVSNAKYLAFDTPNGNAPLLTGHDTFLAYSPNLFSFLTALKLMAPSHQIYIYIYIYFNGSSNLHKMEKNYLQKTIYYPNAAQNTLKPLLSFSLQTT